MIKFLFSDCKEKKILGMSLLTMAVFLVLCVLAKVEISDYIPTYATHMGHVGEEQFIYHLEDSDVIEQDFHSPKDFDMVSLHFSDHDSSIKGKSFISVYEKATGNLVFSEEIENSGISYGKLVDLKFENGGKKNITYTLKLSFDGMDENGLGLYGFKTSQEEEGALVNGVTSEYSVAIGTHTYTNVYQKLVYIVFFMLFITLVISLTLVFGTELKEEYLFLGIALPVGITFLLFLSVNSVHDGSTHLAKVYHYSNLILGCGEEDESNYVLLSDEEAAAFEEIFDNRHRENSIAGQYYDTITQFKQGNETESRRMSHEYRGTNASSFFEYFPGIIGMTVGRLAGGSVRGNLLFTKLCFFAFYVCMIFGAIRIAPCFKQVIAFTGLLPMSLYQATGITYDAVVLAIGLVIFAIYMRAREEELSARYIVLLFGLSYLLGCCKGGFYLPLLLLFLIIPKNLMGCMKKKLFVSVCSLICGGVGMITTSWGAYYSTLKGIFGAKEVTTVLEEGSSAVVEAQLVGVPTYGIGYAFKHIFDFTKMMITTIDQNIDQYIGSLVGYRMAWTDSLVSWGIIFSFIILLILAASNIEEQKENIRYTERLFALFLITMEAVGFHILMLVETPVGAKAIKGVQGRYFLLWVPVMLLVLFGKHRTYTENGIRKLFYYFSIAEVFYLYCFLKIFLGIGA